MIPADIRDAMKLKKRYTFLYMPEDNAASRQVRVPTWTLGAVLVVALMLACFSTLYAVSVAGGAGWLPGGSRFARENQALRRTIAGLQDQVAALRAEIDDVFAVQSAVASAIDLPPLDEETFAAGVGGRGPLQRAGETYGLEADAYGAALMGNELDLMLRQARIQRQGYQAMLDTLAARATVRGQIPSIRPTDLGWLSSRFGFRQDPFTGKQTFHRGLDFSVPVGTDVRVTGDGVVAAVQQQRGFGRVVKVDHGGGVTTVYAHLDEALVKKGAKVQRGQIIARSGNSGRSSAPHLHYEVRVGNRPVNPLTYILDSYASRD
jgi:murein DD-endopeptidase MepM/ murein hydrolase activator NlpD